MSSTFFETLRDETLRIEIGAAAASDLAVENVELSTSVLCRAVRSSIIVRRAGRSCAGGTANRLAMDEVQLPVPVAPVLERCAA
jgi:hypothetical protein